MKRVAVVGGGVIGLSAAWHLSRRGAHPIVVDAGRTGGECSQGNAGWICPSISTPLPNPSLTG
ncbi:MAG: FAD-dependent oxidoreductase, partial [Gemmatimonadota bacterium]|nr:FAD-dependent oxidoreductase [Gemmatimonadota bacterium]